MEKDKRGETRRSEDKIMQMTGMHYFMDYEKCKMSIYVCMAFISHTIKTPGIIHSHRDLTVFHGGRKVLYSRLYWTTSYGVINLMGLIYSTLINSYINKLMKNYISRFLMLISRSAVNTLHHSILLSKSPQHLIKSCSYGIRTYAQHLIHIQINMHIRA